MKVREIVRMLEQHGWREVRMTGSHRHFKHIARLGVVTVPGAMSDEVAPGTLRSIYKQAGIEQR